jgi:hypothetical protein
VIETPAQQAEKTRRSQAMRLDIKTFALTCALFWGFGLFAITWWIMAFEGATGDVTFLGRVYLGYSISPMGSLVGLAWLYNTLARRVAAGSEA